MKTLLLSQRVDKFWQITIQNSTSLQKKLFFLSATQEQLPRLNIAEKCLMIPKRSICEFALRRLNPKLRHDEARFLGHNITELIRLDMPTRDDG